LEDILNKLSGFITESFFALLLIAKIASCGHYYYVYYIFFIYVYSLYNATPHYTVAHFTAIVQHI